MRSIKNKGFTLIELLVVVSIISLLSSIVLSTINSARAKARDAKARSELNQVRIALNLYYDRFGTMPVATTISPETVAFNQIAQTLVTQGFLAGVPVAPANHTYSYYNYGAGSAVLNSAGVVVPVGALLVTTLEAAAPSTGYTGTCRPWPEIVNNWCEDGPNNYYCICNPF